MERKIKIPSTKVVKKWLETKKYPTKQVMFVAYDFLSNKFFPLYIEIRTMGKLNNVKTIKTLFTFYRDTAIMPQIVLYEKYLPQIEFEISLWQR